MQTAAPAAPIIFLSNYLSSDANHISATPLPHPAVVPEHDNLLDKLFGDIIDLIVNANNDPWTTALKTVPVPPPAVAPRMKDEHAGEDVTSDFTRTETDMIRMDMNQ